MEVYRGTAGGSGVAALAQTLSNQAAKQANAHVFISEFPEGYETVVGDRGMLISGGQKQRIAIARTILKNPSIFFFDEATSALDSSTEKQIQENLEKISKGKTTLVIAHRLSTAADADNIIVLDKGEIVEEGSHEELLALSKTYKQMWEKQKKIN